MGATPLFGKAAQAFAPGAVGLFLLRQVVVLVVDLPAAGQLVTKHDFSDVGLCQGREIRPCCFAQVMNRPVRHLVFLVPTQPLHDVVRQLQGSPCPHRLICAAVGEQVGAVFAYIDI